MNTDNNSLAESLEKLARDMEYPPLNGGPTGRVKLEIQESTSGKGDPEGDRKNPQPLSA